MIAAVLLAVGLLAVAGAARESYRLSALGSGLTRSARIAQSRAGRIQAAGCSAAGGSAVAGPFAERWTVRALPGLREVALEVEFRTEGRRRVYSVAWAQVCRDELP